MKLNKSNAIFRNMTQRFLSLVFFKSLKILHLILFLIIIMILFLCAQGFLGIINSNELQRENTQLFNTAFNYIKSIDSLHLNLLYIKENYLKRVMQLSDSSSLDYTFKSIDSNLQEIQKISQATSNTRNGEITSEPEKDLVLAIEELKKIAYGADTKENFLECENIVSRAIKDLNNVRVQVQESSYNILTESKNINESQKNILIIVLIIGFIVAASIGGIINLSISWPLREIIKSARLLATGDFSQNIISFGCRESNDVGTELNISIKSLRILIGNINDESDKIAIASENLKLAAKNSGRSADEVAGAMRTLSDASLNQTDRANQTVLKTKTLGNMVRKISSDTIDISNMSEHISVSAQSGQSITNEVSKEINQLYISTNEINDIVKNFLKATDEIGEITSEIEDITNEITLLSLNASIESARAGEHGKGFSVVATATGKLAERCRIAAQTIGARINQLGESTNTVVSFMEREISSVADGKKLTDEAAITFSGIFNELKTVLSGITKITESIRDMDKHNDEMFNEVMNIALITETNMAHTEEISGITEEQLSTAMTLTSHADHLLLIANEMKQATKIFKV